MTEQSNFERSWLGKLSRSLREIAGVGIAGMVMQGSDDLSSDSDPGEVIAWTRQAMERLEGLVDKKQAKQVMTGCACRYPREALSDIRKTWEETGDLGLTHQKLQEKFEAFLRDTLDLPEDLLGNIITKGWGLAGIRDGHRIIATKIPKSGNLLDYVREEDPARKRGYYCHCPRVRAALRTGDSIPRLYCYCGAGFYRGVWEEILQEPVEVELLESVLDGGQVCKIAIHLP